MAAANPQPLQARPFEDHMRGPVPVGGGDEEEEEEEYEDGGGCGNDGGDEAMEDLEVTQANSVSVAEPGGVVMASRTSELTLSFEGEVYVFPAVTPEKVCHWVSFFLLLYLPDG